MRSLLDGARAVGHGFRALSNRNYRLFWTGQLISLMGTWMQDTALALLVLHLTNSPLALGLTMTIRFTPALLLSLVGGVLADRLPKRATLIGTQSIQLAVALALAVLASTNAITVGLIYALAALRGTVDAVDMPTRQAFIAEMVGTKDLPNAVALNSMQFNVARIVGPAIGAIVIATVGLAACFYLNAASFLAVIIAYSIMRESQLFAAARASGEGVLLQVRQGVRYAAATPDVLVILMVMAAIGTFGYNFQTMLPLLSTYVLHSGATGLSILLASMGIGSVVAGLVVAYRGTATLRLLLVAAAVFTALLFVVGFSRWEPVTAILVLLMGACGVLFMTTANTRLQLVVPGHMRGRVMGMYALLFVGTTPIGSALVGTLAQRTGVPAMVVEMAGLCAMGVIAGLWYARRRRNAALHLSSELAED
jgi:MFS family permease